MNAMSERLVRFALVLVMTIVAGFAAVKMPSPYNGIAAGLFVLGAGALRSYLERGPKRKPGGGESLLPVVFVFCGALLVASAQPACSADQNRRIIDAGLSVAQIACVFASDLTDAPALAQACGVIRSPEFDAILRRLIAQREGARKAGVRWVPLELDGGVLVLVEAGAQ